MARNALKDIVKDAVDGEVDIDFSGASEGGGDFLPLPPNDYEVFVESCEPGESKKGDPKLVFVFKLEDPIDGFTQTVYKHCPTRGTGSGILRDVLRGLGFDVDTMSKFNPQDAVDRKAIITVRYQKGNADFNEIKKVKPLPGAKRATGAAKATGARKRTSSKLS